MGYQSVLKTSSAYFKCDMRTVQSSKRDSWADDFQWFCGPPQSKEIRDHGVERSQTLLHWLCFLSDGQLLILKLFDMKVGKEFSWQDSYRSKHF